MRFVPSGRGKAQCPPDPAYPDGVSVNATRPGEEGCVTELPYPAPECGHWRICCATCGMTVVVTAAGRPDDPRELTIPCMDQIGGMIVESKS